MLIDRKRCTVIDLLEQFGIEVTPLVLLDKLFNVGAWTGRTARGHLVVDERFEGIGERDIHSVYVPKKVPYNYSTWQ